MKKIFLPISVAVLVGFTTLTGCKKEGCTDGIAKNFDSKAKKDDGSCSYEASVQFWFDAATSLDMSLDDISTLTVYIGDEELGTYLVDDFSDSTPSCGASGIISKTFQLGSSKSKKVSFEIVDDNDEVVDSGDLVIEASAKCNNYQIEY